jgi:HSP20 family protein
MAIRDLIPSRMQSTAPSLWRDNEWSPIGSFRREMDRLFDDFFRTPTVNRLGDFGTSTTSWPTIDVKDRDNELVVTAEVPGMTEKDVELFIDNGILTIRGEKKAEQEEKGYSERFYGRFERQIPLPTSVDDQNAKADFHDGLLTIHLPKTRGAVEAKKKIPINADTRH